MLRVSLCLIVGAGLLTAADSPRPTARQMKETMIAVHRGDASPYAKAEKEAAAAGPNWEELARHLKPLEAMAKGNAAFSPYNAGPYTAAVTGLRKAVADKDKAKAAAAFAALQKSCVSCHSYGGPASGASEASLRKERPKK